MLNEHFGSIYFFNKYISASAFTPALTATANIPTIVLTVIDSADIVESCAPTVSKNIDRNVTPELIKYLFVV